MMLADGNGLCRPLRWPMTTDQLTSSTLRNAGIDVLDSGGRTYDLGVSGSVAGPSTAGGGGFGTFRVGDCLAGVEYGLRRAGEVDGVASWRVRPDGSLGLMRHRSTLPRRSPSASYAVTQVPSTR